MAQQQPATQQQPTTQQPEVPVSTGQQPAKTETSSNPEYRSTISNPIREGHRTAQIRACRDFLFHDLKRKIRNAIRQQTDLPKNIFFFASPRSPGKKSRCFSWISIHTATGICRYHQLRPESHSNLEWYFPIWYLMNGFHKNPERNFQVLNLKTVQDLLTDYIQNEQKHLHLSFPNTMGNNLVILEKLNPIKTPANTD